MNRRMRAAVAALPFEHPKFAVIQTMSNSRDFAAQLEAARKRSAGALTFRPEIEDECTRVPAEQDTTPARVPNASANAGERAGQVIRSALRRI